MADTWQSLLQDAQDGALPPARMEGRGAGEQGTVGGQQLVLKSWAQRWREAAAPTALQPGGGCNVKPRSLAPGLWTCRHWPAVLPDLDPPVLWVLTREAGGRPSCQLFYHLKLFL